MWFYDDKPYKGTRPADLPDESTDSAGFADTLGRVRVMAWLCAFAFVGFVAWCAK